MAKSMQAPEQAKQVRSAPVTLGLSRYWYLIILALCGFVTSFGAHIVATNLPAYAQTVGVGAFMIGLLIGVYDFAEAVEIHHGRMIDADAKVVLDGVLEQTGSATRIAIQFALLIGGVDALILRTRDGNP